MPDLQALGQCTDRRVRFPAPLERQQQLVLPGLEAGGAGSQFTEMQEPADLMAEIGEGGELGGLQGHAGNIS